MVLISLHLLSLLLLPDLSIELLLNQLSSLLGSHVLSPELLLVKGRVEPQNLSPRIFLALSPVRQSGALLRSEALLGVSDCPNASRGFAGSFSRCPRARENVLSGMT